MINKLSCTRKKEKTHSGTNTTLVRDERPADDSLDRVIHPYVSNKQNAQNLTYSSADEKFIASASALKQQTMLLSSAYSVRDESWLWSCLDEEYRSWQEALAM
jgi:hypothetical protein